MLNNDKNMKSKDIDPEYSKNKKRMKKILDILALEYPAATIQLVHTSPLELLVATILSAQCTDERVNIVTQELFKKYRNTEDYINVPQEELERDIFSTGFYRNKAKHIQACCKEIIERFDGKVPGTMEELTSLPGVGRKSANVVLGHCFSTPGLVVDTHVVRISNLLGFVKTENAVKIEKVLTGLIPGKLWVISTHYFISHGRAVCIARRPQCQICKISAYCPSKK
jgi:endonuclease III